jgi:lipoprotein-anchoring transpeptidase ErfK/SrfK
MQSTRTTFRALLVLALSAALLVPAGTAYAVDAGNPVPNNATVNGQSLKGLSEADARAVIAARTSVPALTSVVIKGAGREHSVTADQARSAVAVNVDAMLAQAYRSDVSSSTAYAVAPVYSVNSAVVAGWTSAYTKKTNRKPVNAKHYVKSRKLRVRAEKNGYTVYQAATSARIAQRLINEANGKPAAVVWASIKTTKPKITRTNIGKAILVVLKYRKVYLYNDTKLVKKYRCAIGTPSHPTPTGKFKIVAKRYRPTWVNPAPNGWGANMPASIAPGPSNPLGVRALNLSASGIRIHGTSKVSSIGHAASHGCIRLTNTNVKDIYKRVKVGTPVFIVK